MSWDWQNTSNVSPESFLKKTHILHLESKPVDQESLNQIYSQIVQLIVTTFFYILSSSNPHISTGSKNNNLLPLFKPQNQSKQ